MQTYILLLACLAPAICYGRAINKPNDHLISFFKDEMPVVQTKEHQIGQVEEEKSEVGSRNIPHGSCGHNKYGTFYDIFNAQSYIVGGTATQPNQYPWQVSLQKLGSHFCGGTIYNEHYIITAAHCFGSTSTTGITVVAGKHTLNKAETTSKTYNIAKVIKHASFSSITLRNDITLLKLSTEITFTDEIQPACLPTVLTNTYEGVNATVTGWGTTREGGSISQTLQHVEVPVISNTKCQQKYSTNQIGPGMICAGYDAGGKDSCQGDSGGPLVYKETAGWTLIGIVSWGSGCARPNLPGVYTRVTEYISWIKTNAV